ncbi:MAG: SUMF1/EgtB/PvdO family nonheme iron enzyme [Victivallales bacterium]|nr:SUMF1/EgtB/PvdO family nonheme iron enzyme [Victivallales bacterium]
MEQYNNVTQMDSRERIRNLYFQSGDVIAGRYEFVRVLGRGGMGVVCLCKDMKDEGRTVALKTVPDILRSDEASAAALREEFRGMLSLTHDGIVTVRSLEDDEFRFYIVMDYAEGETLENYLKKHPKPGLAITREVVHRLAKALDYAHEKNMVHRDVKPANVMVQIDGETVKSLKLLDFGLGLRIKESVSHISGILTGGTPAYKSPEQWRPDLYGFKLTAKADQYALALLAYEMLDGHYPFYNFDITTFPNAVLSVPPPKIDNLPDAVNNALQKALAKKPEDRFDSCMAFAEALEGAQPATSRSSKAEIPKRQQSAVTPTPLPQPPVVTSAPQASLESVERKGNLTFKLAEDVDLEMVWIPAGTFMMGSPENELGRNRNETLHKVTLTKGFWIGKYPVTQAQYKAVIGENPSEFKEIVKTFRPVFAEPSFWQRMFGEKPKLISNEEVSIEVDDSRVLPVENVSWEEAFHFCCVIHERHESELPSGYEFCLPTEAQWEYACRAGTTTALNSGLNLMNAAGEDSRLNALGWYGKNSDGKTHPVGEKKPNNWGIYDMHGNVWEWCRDYWEEKYPTDAVTDPIGPSSGSGRVHRGGSWGSYAAGCRSACRGSLDPTSHSILGFRVALVRVQ